MNRTELLPFKSPIVNPGDSLVEALLESLARSWSRMRNGDIVAVASKVVSISENRIVKLNTVKPSGKATRLSRQFGLTPEFAQVIINEADRIYSGVEGAVLTLKDGHVTANAGADRKNSPGNSAVIWPRDPSRSAKRLQSAIKGKTGKAVSVIIVDSRVTPLRLGTVGLCLASVGFKPVRDFRKMPDLGKRKIRITYQAIGDGLAAAAHVLMGEAEERVPFVIVRGAPVTLNGNRGISEKMQTEDCLYMSQIRPLTT